MKGGGPFEGKCLSGVERNVAEGGHRCHGPSPRGCPPALALPLTRPRVHARRVHAPRAHSQASVPVLPATRRRCCARSRRSASGDAVRSFSTGADVNAPEALPSSSRARSRVLSAVPLLNSTRLLTTYLLAAMWSSTSASCVCSQA